MAAALVGEPDPPALVGPPEPPALAASGPAELPPAPLAQSPTTRPEPAAPLAPPPAAAGGGTRGGLLAGLVAFLVLALIVGVALAGLKLRDAREERADLAGEQDDREEAVAAARSFAVLLTSYDYKQIDKDVAAVSAGAGDSARCEKGADGKPIEGAEGCFKAEYSVAGGAQFQKLVKDNKAVSKGEVRSAGVVSSSDGRVVVLLAVDQTVTNANRPAPRVDRNRIQFTLERIDGKWLVVDVAVL
jgi:Mce-associated membrane protein